MKRFDVDKVRKVAIDKPHHQQIFVRDKKNKALVIQTLKDMGFTTDQNSPYACYEDYPLIINVNKKEFYSLGSYGIMTYPKQNGATILDYEGMIQLM